MSIIEKLKESRIAARKKSDNVLSSFYAFVISEVEKVGKNSGNRLTTEDESIRVIEKTLANIEETVAVSKDNVNPELLKQIEVLKTFIPEKVSEDVVRNFIVGLKENNISSNKGMYMKELKAKFGSNVDMKVAGSIVDEVISNG